MCVQNLRRVVLTLVYAESGGMGRYVGFTPIWERTICGFLDPFALRRRRFGAL